MTGVERGWDTRGVCCKAGCGRRLGITADGIQSVHCQKHTEEWEARLSILQERVGPPPPDPVDVAVQFAAPSRRPEVAFAIDVPPPPRPMCDRCQEAPAQAHDQLCEECRRGG